ncbi:MAG: riboflavin kinase, partial [Opitutales bacterium]
RFGVYRVRLRAAGATQWEDGIANYGVKPTVSETAEPALEVHVLDGTDLDAGASVEVEWLDFLRGEQKFETEAVLRAQIAQDVAWARKQVSDG